MDIVTDEGTHEQNYQGWGLVESAVEARAGAGGVG